MELLNINIMKNEKIKILLVEDNEGDIVLTQEAFEMANIQSDIDVVRDGEQAINYLIQIGELSGLLIRT